MGTETNLPDVEESTEPPICSSNEGHPKPTLIKHSACGVPGVIEIEEVLQIRDTQEGDTKLENYEEQIRDAHTISAIRVAHILGVDLQ
jgi:hypothetical protein